MKIQDYLAKPINERLDLTKEKVTSSTPLFLERLKTALENSSPLALFIFPELRAEYWTLKELKA